MQQHLLINTRWINCFCTYIYVISWAQATIEVQLITLNMTSNANYVKHLFFQKYFFLYKYDYFYLKFEYCLPDTQLKFTCNISDDIIYETGNENVILKQLDTSSLESVRKFAADINATESR